MTATPEHETAAEVAEFLGLTYVPGLGAFRDDGELVYMDDTSYLMSEEREKEVRAYRRQDGYSMSERGREGVRSQSKLMWRDVGTNIMRFAFFGNRGVMDMHLPSGGESLSLYQWKEARRDMERERKPSLAQLSDNT